MFTFLIQKYTTLENALLNLNGKILFQPGEINKNSITNLRVINEKNNNKKNKLFSSSEKQTHENALKSKAWETNENVFKT